jgi:hypothetical protein
VQAALSNRSTLTPTGRRIRPAGGSKWGGQGEGSDRGWLELVEAADGSAVTIQIQTEPDRPDDEVLIKRGFDETLDRIAPRIDGNE